MNIIEEIINSGNGIAKTAKDYSDEIMINVDE